MEIFIFWVGVSFLAGIAAAQKGRSFVGFLLLSLLLSPLIGLIAALIAAPDRGAVEVKAEKSGDMKKCPYCAEMVKAEAKLCRYCGKPLDDTKTPGGIVLEE